MPARDVTFAKDNYYHVYNRGASRKSIFRQEENYRYALRLLKKYARQCKVAVIAYCLLPNHYHFLLRQDGSDPAGRVPQYLFNAYTKAYNKRYEHTGTLFEGRFKAVHVDNEPYLIHVCRYIHANPVKHGLVLSPSDWPYSNYHEWTSARPGSLIDHDFVQTYFPNPQEYATFVRHYLLDRHDLPPDVHAYLRHFDDG